MDKLRADFEEDFENETGWPAGEHPSQEVADLCWRIYQQSRASIVVELPEEKEDKARNCSSDDVAYGFNQGVGACRNSLRSIGLSIKGE